MIYNKHRPLNSMRIYKGALWLSGRVLDSRPKGRGFEPHWRHCVVSLSKNINPSLVLVQHRKARPYITERLLMGRKESNQTNKRVYTQQQKKRISINYALLYDTLRLFPFINIFQMNITFEMHLLEHIFYTTLLPFILLKYYLTQDTTWERDNNTIKHHKREQRGQPFPSK